MATPNIDVKLRSEDTDGVLGFVVNRVGAGWDGPPLHHHDFDEAFYVLEGELTFQLGEEIRTAGPGEVVFAPRNSVHTLANLSDGEAAYAIVITPGGFERYFDKLAAKFAGTEPPATAERPYPPTTVVGPHIREHLGA